MVDVYAAVEHFLNGGAEATQRMAESIAGELTGIPSISVSVAASHVHVHFAQHRPDLRGIG